MGQEQGEAEAAAMGDSAERAVSATAQDLALTPEEERVVRALLAALRRIQHGSVQVVVQDSRAVQIDTVEKMRLVPGPRNT
jgi:hypothetical protein